MRHVRPAPFLAASLACGLLLQGCQTGPLSATATTAPAIGTGWRKVATQEDQRRLDRLAGLWGEALAAARKAGFARRIAAEGALLQIDGQRRIALSPGAYRCRIVRLGAPGGKAYQSFDPYFCHVAAEGEQLSLTKQTGSERPAGYLWEDGPDRMIFVGAVAMGGETGPPAYGDDPARNLVGIAERVGDFRYRVAMPRAREVATLDLLELVPVVPAE